MQQYTTRWNRVHHRIDEALKEIEASLEGDPIISLEVLNVKEYRLMQAKESLKESSNLVSLIIIEDPSRTSELLGLEDARALQIVTKVSACEESIARIRGVINAKKASSTEAVVPAITELITALASRPDPTTRRTIGPKFERQSLPHFRSGELRDYPTFKKDWEEMVKGNFEPAQER